MNNVKQQRILTAKKNANRSFFHAPQYKHLPAIEAAVANICAYNEEYAEEATEEERNEYTVSQLTLALEELQLKWPQADVQDIRAYLLRMVGMAMDERAVSLSSGINNIDSFEELERSAAAALHHAHLGKEEVAAPLAIASKEVEKEYKLQAITYSQYAFTENGKRLGKRAAEARKQWLEKKQRQDSYRNNRYTNQTALKKELSNKLSVMEGRVYNAQNAAAVRKALRDVAKLMSWADRELKRMDAEVRWKLVGGKQAWTRPLAAVPFSWTNSHSLRFFTTKNRYSKSSLKGLYNNLYFLLKAGIEEYKEISDYENLSPVAAPGMYVYLAKQKPYLIYDWRYRKATKKEMGSRPYGPDNAYTLTESKAAVEYVQSSDWEQFRTEIISALYS